MNILFPIAGLGTRFKKDGYVDPKPFVKFKGKPLIEWALSSLKLEGRYYVIVNGLEEKYREVLYEISKKYFLDLEIVDIGRSTRGQAETCLCAVKEANIDTDQPLIITNCDQYTPWNPNRFLSFIRENNPDGVVSTYNHPTMEIGLPSPYSHVKLDEDGYAVQLAEKVAISPLALNGIFYWKTGQLFWESASKMMVDDSDAGWGSGAFSYVKEKYVAPTYNYLISAGKKIINYHMEDD